MHALSHLLRPFEATPADAAEAIERGGLAGWSLAKIPMRVLVDGKPVAMPGQYVVAGAGRVYGPVSARYKVTPNEDHAAFLDALALESGATFYAAGEVDGLVLVALRLHGFVRIGGDDVVTYLVVSWAHDGSEGRAVRVVPMTRDAVIDVALIRRADDAAAVLDDALDYLEAFQARGRAAAHVSVSQANFERTIDAAWAPSPGAAPATQTRAENKLSAMSLRFAELPAGATAWGARVALAQWADFDSHVRGDAPATLRARNALFDDRLRRAAEPVLARLEAGAR